MIKKVSFFCLFTTVCITMASWAANPVVNLTVEYKTINFSGKSVQALAFNNQIPGPTLRFKEGDHVTINVYNHLQEPTSVHWHGIILPWYMDGVERVSQPPIAPGGVFHYQYTIHQSPGTYWYHAHANLQEQQGLYGALIIEPLHDSFHYNKEFVVMLSDWSNTHPDQIVANLKKDGDYYSPNFPIQPSLVHFIKDYRNATTEGKKTLWEAYSMMQTSRMSPYDFSDVAYDTFLLNGHPPTDPWQANVKVGDVVRLRLIDGGASTLFYFKIPDTIMRVIEVQGNKIIPYTTDKLELAPGETYDVLITIKKTAPYYLYAESSDKVGTVYGALTTELHQALNFSQITPFPMPAPNMMMMSDMEMDHSANDDVDPNMGMSTMNDMKPSVSQKGAQPIASDPIGTPESTPTKYQDLRSPSITNNPNLPVHIIKMELAGYMDKYIWFINGVPEYHSKPIQLVAGQRYRLIFINQTMMHHPMHIHGHWLILRNGHGAYDPLLHTIDVPPNATVVADFDADANGRWYLHCHNLYHMMAGMAVVVQYTGIAAPNVATIPVNINPVLANDITSMMTYHDATAHPARWYQATRLDLANIVNQTNSYQGTLKSLMGPDYNKLELYSQDAQINNGTLQNAALDIFYWHLISEFWAIKGGANYVHRLAQSSYWQPGIGIEGLLPYFITTDVRIYQYLGSTQLHIDLSRDTQITNNFFISVEAQSIVASKTVDNADIGSGLNVLEYSIKPYYRLTPYLSVFTKYEYTQNYGSLKNNLATNGAATHDNELLAGVSLLF